jgi:hypothetical protein
MLQDWVGLEVRLELCLQIAELAVQMRDVLVQGFAQEAVGTFQVEAIAFLLAHGLERFAAANQGLELAVLARQRRPGRRLVRNAEARDQCGIGFVGLGAGQFTVGEGADAGWVHDADAYAVLVEKLGERFAVGARGFQRGVEGGERALVATPAEQFGEAGGGVGEEAMVGLRVVEQHGVEFGFGDIEAENNGRSCHE